MPSQGLIHHQAGIGVPSHQQAIGGGRAVVEGIKIHLAVGLLLIKGLDGPGHGGDRDGGVDARGLGHQQQVQPVMGGPGTQLGQPAPQQPSEPRVGGQRNQRRRCGGLAPPVGIEEVQGGHHASASFPGCMQGRGKTVRKGVRGGNERAPGLAFR